MCDVELRELRAFDHKETQEMPERTQYNFTRLIKDSDWDIIRVDSSFFAYNPHPFPSSGWRVTTWFVIVIMYLQINANNFWNIFPLNMFPSVLNIFVQHLFINALSYSLFPKQRILLKETFKTSWKLHSHIWY